jgi:hypothetical protein
MAQLSTGKSSQPVLTNKNEVIMKVNRRFELGMSLNKECLDYVVHLNQKGNPNSESQKLIDKARAFRRAAPVRAGLSITFSNTPVAGVVINQEGRDASVAYCAARTIYKATRRVANREAFTLINILGLVTRRHGKVTRNSTKGFGTVTIVSSGTSAGKTVNNRKINQQIARAQRVSRQRRNGRRSQVSKTSQQRGADRAARAAKQGAKLARRRAAQAFLDAQRKAAVMALGVTPKGHKAPAMVRGVRVSTTPIPTTRSAKSSALRGAHDGVYYVNGTEVPVVKTVVAHRQAILRKERNALPLAVRNRRLAAENGTRFHRDAEFGARRALSRHIVEVPVMPVWRMVPTAPAPEVTVADFEAKAKAIMAEAKVKYGAGDLQMSLNSNSSDRDIKSGLEALPVGDSMDNIVKLVSDLMPTAQPVASIHADHASNDRSLGYYVSLCCVYVDGSGRQTIKGNINLPIQAHFSKKQWPVIGEPMTSEDASLNESSLLKVSAEQPVLKFRTSAAYNTGNYTPCGMWLSKAWERPYPLRKKYPEISPEISVMLDGKMTVANLAKPAEGKDNITLQRAIVDARLEVWNAIMGATTEVKAGGCTVKGGLGAKLQPGRNWVVVVADVTAINGASKEKGGFDMLFNVTRPDGVVSVEGSLAKEDLYGHGRDFAYERMAAQSIEVLYVPNLSDIYAEKVLGPWHPSISEGLARGFYGDLPELAVDTKSGKFKYAAASKGIADPKRVRLCDLLDWSYEAYVMIQCCRENLLNQRGLPSGSRVVTKPAAPVVKAKAAPTVTTEPTKPVDVAPVIASLLEAVTAAPAPAPAQQVAIVEPEVEVKEPTSPPKVEVVATKLPERPVVPTVEPNLQGYAGALSQYLNHMEGMWVNRELANITDISVYCQEHVQAWANLDKTTGFNAEGVQARTNGVSGAFGVIRYLADVTKTEGDCKPNLSFYGFDWQPEHVMNVIAILRSYESTNHQDDLCYFKPEAGGYIFSFLGKEFAWIPELNGVIDLPRGRMFKNVVMACYSEELTENDQLVKIYRGAQAMSSMGSFMRYLYMVVLPVMAHLPASDDWSAVGANLNQYLNKDAGVMFPMSSDNILSENANFRWAESNSWAPMGLDVGSTMPTPVVNVDKKFALINCWGIYADKLIKAYATNYKQAKLTNAEFAENLLPEAMSQLGITWSFNKNVGYSMPNFAINCLVLAEHAPAIYELVKAQFVIDMGGSKAVDEFLAASKFESLDLFLRGCVVNSNGKVAKGTKRQLLRAPNSVQSGSYINCDRKPKLAKMLAAGRGVKPVDTLWAGMLPENFYAVGAGHKFSTQPEPITGTAIRVALGLTAVGPAGVVAWIGGPNQMPHGFGSNIEQSNFEIPQRAIEVQPGVGFGADDIQLVRPELAVDFRQPECVLADVELVTEVHRVRGIEYYYFKPQTAVYVHGNGGSVVCNVFTNDELAPSKPFAYESNNGDGILEWVRVHVAPEITGKNLEVEFKVTTMERQAKIRSSVAKANLMPVKSSFLKLNGVAGKLVDAVYLQDAMKIDVDGCLISVIGVTLVLNPDCNDPEFLAMVELAKDINEMVEGRRHLDYLVEDHVSMVAQPKYTELQTRFYNYFKRENVWTMWEELEHGDFGYAIDRLYTDMSNEGLDSWRAVTDALEARELVMNLAADVTDEYTYKCFTNDKDNVFVLFINEAGRVAKVAQRSTMLVGRNNCPIYDVVLYEAATTRQGINNNTSGQMDVCMRSLRAMTDAWGIGNDGLAKDLIRRQGISGKTNAMWRAKMLHLSAHCGLSKAIDGRQVIKLGEWKEADKGQATWVPNSEVVATIKSILGNADVSNVSNFGGLCEALKGYIFTVDASRKEYKVDEESGEVYAVSKSIEVWTPFLYYLNGRSAEDNSHSTASGLFQAYLAKALSINPDARSLGIIANQLCGRMDSWASSEGVRKFISGGEVFGGKVIAMPNLPTGVMLLYEGDDQWANARRVAKHYGLDLRNVPTWADYKAFGEAVWDMPERTEAFNHLTRSPIKDGPVQRVLRMPKSVEAYKDTFYCFSNPWVYNPLSSKNVLANPYPYTIGVSVIAMTGVTKGDSDGDGVSATFLVSNVPGLRGLVTAEDKAWESCDKCAGLPGAQARLEVYLGDHLSAPSLAKKANIFFRKGMLAVSFKDGGVSGKHLVLAETYNTTNVRSLILQTMQVGVSYKVYRLTEAITDILNGLVKGGVFKAAGLEVPEMFKPFVGPQSYYAVTACADIYEYVLGAVDALGWQLWGMLKSVMEAKFAPMWHAPLIHIDKTDGNTVDHNAEAEAKAVLFRQSKVAELTGILGKAGVNTSQADAMATAFWLASYANGTVKQQSMFMFDVQRSDRRLAQFIIAAAMLVTEAGRAKWHGFNHGPLNSTALASDEKVANHKKMTTVTLDYLTKGVAAHDVWVNAVSESHCLQLLMDMADPETLGDLVVGPPANTAIDYFVNADLVAHYESQLAARVGDVNMVEIKETVVDVEVCLDIFVTDEDEEFDLVDPDADIYDDYQPTYDEEEYMEMLANQAMLAQMLAAPTAVIEPTDNTPTPHCVDEDMYIPEEQTEEDRLATQQVMAQLMTKPQAAPAPVVMPAPTEDQIFLAKQAAVEAEISDLETRLVKAQELLAKQEAQAKALRKLEDKKAKLSAKLADVVAKLSPEYLAMLEDNTQPEEDEDNGGGNVKPEPDAPKPPSDDHGQNLSIDAEVQKVRHDLEQLAARARDGEVIGRPSPEPAPSDEDMYIPEEGNPAENMAAFAAAAATSVTATTNEVVTEPTWADFVQSIKWERGDVCEVEYEDGTIGWMLGQEVIPNIVSSDYVDGRLWFYHEKPNVLFIEDGLTINDVPDVQGWELDLCDDIRYVTGYVGGTITTTPEAKKETSEVKSPDDIVATLIESYAKKSQPKNLIEAKTKARSLPCPPIDDEGATDCQKRFFEAACTGDNIFLSGEAGTGKTYALESMINHWLELGDKVIVTATTGRAAMNMGARFDIEDLAGYGTFNSVLGLGIGFGEKDAEAMTPYAWSQRMISRGQSNDELEVMLKGSNQDQRVHFVLDEVSMLDARMLWVIWNILYYHNPCIQVILAGDGDQLKVIGKGARDFWQRPYLEGCNGTLETIIDKFRCINLKTNVRQADDPELAAALKHLSETNEITGVLLERFRLCAEEGLKPSDDLNTTYIRYNNVSVERINRRMTRAMGTETRVYKAQVVGNNGPVTVNNDRYPGWVYAFSPIAPVMEFAVGMPVKLRKNRKKDGVLEASNGSRGFITKLGKEHVWVEFEDGKELKINFERFEGPHVNGNSVGAFYQLPIHPDFATTGHSVQGMTITNEGVISVSQEWKCKDNHKQFIFEEDGEHKVYKVALNDAQWLLVACSRFTKASDIYFQYDGPEDLHWLFQAQGNKDLSYREWLASKAKQ